MSRVLLVDGHEVAVFDNLSQGHRAAIPRGCRSRRGDLSDAREVKRVLMKTRRANCAYDLGSQHGFSVLQVLAAARTVTARRIPRRVTVRRAGDVPRRVASSARIRAELGWRPTITSLEQMIADAWEWHPTNPDRYADGTGDCRVKTWNVFRDACRVHADA
jgi:UDP-glucose 4-epimerase